MSSMINKATTAINCIQVNVHTYVHNHSKVYHFIELHMHVITLLTFQQNECDTRPYYNWHLQMK